MLQVCDDLGIRGFDQADWEKLKCLAKLLRLFRVHTDCLQGSAIGIDKILPSFLQLKITLSKVHCYRDLKAKIR